MNHERSVVEDWWHRTTYRELAMEVCKKCLSDDLEFSISANEMYAYVSCYCLYCRTKEYITLEGDDEEAIFFFIQNKHKGMPT